VRIEVNGKPVTGKRFAFYICNLCFLSIIVAGALFGVTVVIGKVVQATGMLDLKRSPWVPPGVFTGVDIPDTGEIAWRLEDRESPRKKEPWAWTINDTLTSKVGWERSGIDFEQIPPETKTDRKFLITFVIPSERTYFPDPDGVYATAVPIKGGCIIYFAPYASVFDDFFRLAVNHEVGHCLGLRHSSNPFDVMSGNIASFPSNAEIDAVRKNIK